MSIEELHALYASLIEAYKETGNINFLNKANALCEKLVGIV